VSPLYIVFRTSENLYPPYLKRFLLSDAGLAQIDHHTQGAVRDSLKFSGLQKIQIPLPPIDEQKRIAVVLDKADALRRQRQQSLHLTEKLIQSVFLDMFGDLRTNSKGWEETTLGEVISDGPQNGLYQPQSDYGTGTRILRIDGFYNGSIVDEAKLKRLRLSSDNENRYLLREGDIVVNRVNSLELLGKSALIPKFKEPVVFESNIMRMGVSLERMVPRFLIAMLQDADIKRQIAGRAKKAVNQASINQTDVRGLRIFEPPILLQGEYVRRVKHLEQLLQYEKQHEDIAHGFFASLQQRAFRGELDLSRLVLEPSDDAPAAISPAKPVTTPRELKGVARFLQPRAALEPILKKLDRTVNQGGTIPWSADYFKYRILGTQSAPFSFADLMQEVMAVFEESPPYEAIRDQIFDLLGQDGQPTFLRQRFDLQTDLESNEVTGRKEIVFEPVP
jgi:type I restriction enzyme S subunit